MKKKIVDLVVSAVVGDICPSDAILKKIQSLSVSEFSELRAYIKSLWQDDEKFHGIFKSAGIGIVVANMEGYPIEVNSTFEKMIGYSRTQLAKMDFYDFTYPDDIALDQSFFSEIKEGKRDKYDLEKRYIRKDGRVIWVHVTVSLIRGADNKPMWTIGAIREITKRKQTEEQLRQLAEAVKQSPATVVITDLDGNIQYVNPKFTQITGYSIKEAAGLNPRILKSGITPPEVYNELWMTIKQGKIWQGEFLNKKKNGELYWEAASISPIKNEQGVITHFVAVKEDITGRKKAEEVRERLLRDLKKKTNEVQSLADKLKNERDLLEIIQENTKAHLAYLDPDFNFINVNSAYMNGAHSTREELIGKNYFELRPNPELKAVFERVRKTGRAVEFKARPFNFPSKEGDKEITYWDWTLIPVKNDEGKVVGLVYSLLDVTEEKYREQEIREGNWRLNMIIESVDDGITVSDSNGHFEVFNTKMKEITGYTMDEANATIDFTKLIYPDRDARKEALRGVHETIIKGGYREGETTITAKDGSRKILLVSTSLIHYKNKDMFLSVYRDITTSKALDKQKDEFLSIASHELKTPLTSIKLFTQILHQYLLGLNDSRSMHFISRMEAQVDKLTGLVKDLLDVTRVQTGRLELTRKWFSINKLIKEVASEVGLSTGNTHRILIKGSVKQPIRADKERIEQVIRNLLDNAIKYSPDGDKIIVRIMEREEEITISVQDFGIGIGSDQKIYIFEQFYQAREDKKQKGFLGLGLGLYICSAIIKAHTGKIWVESELQKGSTFYFTIPRK